MRVNEIITNKIIEQIESGVAPWSKPWVGGMPTNYVSKKPYTGINPWMLNWDAEEFGYSSQYWLTFNQIKQEGATLKKGSKSSMVIYANTAKSENEEGEEYSYSFLRYYRVFNADCVEGLNIPQGLAESKPDADKIINDYQIDKRDGGSRAYYSVSGDYIQIPHKQIFTSLEGYYNTVYHEMIHSTGHKTRLNRFKDGEAQANFGSESYSKEELIAELGASFLMNTVGFSNVEQSSAYIKGWLKPLKNDPSFVISASSKAQKAFDFILN